MNAQQIKEKAKALGLNCDVPTKRSLIHAIQITEGNFPCFDTAREYCDQDLCCWRTDCLAPRWYDQAHLEVIKEELQRLTKITILSHA
ncbi:MAG: hypothetical protein SD837_14160 [Candidatus Electrothrix scaldis]|nr:MAG: hypothetical protein SD837_14160 [Candidatus Electrothrix sp. GW3-3]